MAENEKCEVDRDTQRQREKEREQKFTSLSMKPVPPWDCSYRREPANWDLLTATASQSREDENRRKTKTKTKKNRATDNRRGKSIVGNEGGSWETS